jgi:hypothetical protein
VNTETISESPSRAASRTIIWLYTLASAVLAPLLNFGIALATGLDLASFTIYEFIPVGTLALCALACGGFLLGAARTIYLPDTIDLVFLMIASISAIVLGFAFEYVYLMIKYDVSAEQLGTFGRFVYVNITEAQVTSYSRQFGVSAPAAAGDAGLLVMLIRLAGAAAVAKAVHSTMVSRAVNLS